MSVGWSGRWQAGGFKVSVVQASRVRQFARAAGILAKTDSIDAQVLCVFGEALRPDGSVASLPQQDRLREVERPAPALKPSAGGRAKSWRPTRRSLHACVKPQPDQANQKT